MLVEFGNAYPQEVLSKDGNVERRAARGPAVTYSQFPDGADEAGNPLYSHPDVHEDHLFEDPELVAALAGYPEGDGKAAARRMLVKAHFTSRPDGVSHLPNHAAFTSVAHPNGIWANVSAPGTGPSWVWSNNDAFAGFLGEHYDCPVGRPAGLEDSHWTKYGTNTYMPGAQPDPLGGIEMMHTSWGRDQQSLVQFGYGAINVVGTATTTSSTSLTGGSETGSFSHASNDAAGMILTILTPSGDAGKWLFVKSNTSGTSPVYSGDRWYVVNSAGGAAATTPSTVSTYVLSQGGAPAPYVALSTDTTAPSLGGTGGTQDASAATTALTSEITTASGGLIRKIGVLTHTAGTATTVNTVTFTANGSDSLPAVVAKAALCTSLTSGGGGLTYMTLVSPTATLSASGDTLTTTWSFTAS